MVRVLSSGRWRAVDLAAELGLHLRTVYRALAGFRAVGLEVERQQEGSEVYWRIRPEAFERWRGSCRRASVKRRGKGDGDPSELTPSRPSGRQSAGRGAWGLP
mgnify:CR=1 FL=1